MNKAKDQRRLASLWAPGKIARAVAATATTAALFAGGQAHAASSGNLIVNGDGETGLCTSDWKAVTTVPGWQVLAGNPSLACYG
ncbi:MAG: hypothetical protein ACRETW_02800, partial [Stenotrophobium sp.]